MNRPNRRMEREGRKLIGGAICSTFSLPSNTSTSNFNNFFELAPKLEQTYNQDGRKQRERSLSCLLRRSSSPHSSPRLNRSSARTFPTRKGVGLHSQEYHILAVATL